MTSRCPGGEWLKYQDEFQISGDSSSPTAARPSVDDAGVSSCHRLRHGVFGLEKMSLIESQISDVGVAVPLRQSALAQLTELNLGGNQIGDDDVIALATAITPDKSSKGAFANPRCSLLLERDWRCWRRGFKAAASERCQAQAAESLQNKIGGVGSRLSQRRLPVGHCPS